MTTRPIILDNNDGYLIVDVGDGAQMTCPTSELEWRMRYGDAPALIAASVIDSFSYLITNCTKEEAWRRILIMRAAMKNGRESEE